MKTSLIIIVLLIIIGVLTYFSMPHYSFHFIQTKTGYILLRGNQATGQMKQIEPILIEVKRAEFTKPASEQPEQRPGPQ